MALSERARTVKAELARVVEQTRLLQAAREEWEELLRLEEHLAVAEDWAAEIHSQRYALQKELAQAQLNNWTRLRKAALTDGEWKVMRWRYVEGLAWSDIIARAGKSKQYLLRLHNRALEKCTNNTRDSTRGLGNRE